MRIFKIGITVIALACSSMSFAGNEDRAGEAGASELLINPWGRSSGWGGANTSGAQGVESFNLNIAGLAYTKGSELVFTNTNWLSGTDISINALGFATRLGENGGVLGISAMSMTFGDIDITTADNPDGGLGTFSPNYFNMDKSQAKERIEQLTRELREHNYRYYNEDAPTISDYDFDVLLKELEKLEQAYPDLADDNSPTKRVGGEVSKNFETKKHRYPM